MSQQLIVKETAEGKVDTREQQGLMIPYLTLSEEHLSLIFQQ